MGTMMMQIGVGSQVIVMLIVAGLIGVIVFMAWQVWRTFRPICPVCGHADNMFLDSARGPICRHES